VGTGEIRVSDTAVQEILNKVELLSDEERFYLVRLLTDKAEAGWRLNASAARRAARERGIDQSAIDRAVEEVRSPR
jgi:hypothetical protein